jgi:predicted transport protein
MEQSYGNEYKSSFDWFMRDYLAVKTGSIPVIARVYDGFKNFIQSKHAPVTITEVVKDIHRYSSYYVNMVLHKEPDTALQSGFKNISRLKVDVSYPFFLAVYADYVAGRVSKSAFIEIIGLVENYVFRRAICGIPTNSMNKTFATLYRHIDKTNYIEGVKAAFQLLDTYKCFPTDADFEREIVIKDVYNFRNRNYLLAKLENYKRKEPVNLDDYTIEHVMPQNPDLSKEWQEMLGPNWKEVQNQYLHTLGNLTLTGYNSELSDKPFKQKKSIDGGFNDSPIRLNDFMRKVDVWNEDIIKSRAKELAEKAKQIWAAPNLPQSVLDKYKPAEKEAAATYTLEQYDHIKGDMLDLYQALKKRIMNIDSSVVEEYKKLYIAFKSNTNFVDIIPQKARLRLSLNIPYPEIIDPLGLCRDVTDLGRWGNGDVEVGVSNISELDQVMDLIQQAFDKQFE